MATSLEAGTTGERVPGARFVAGQRVLLLHSDRLHAGQVVRPNLSQDRFAGSYAVHVPALAYLVYEFGRQQRAVSGSPAIASLDRFGDRFGLSPREREVVRLLLEGKSNRQMEEALFISLQTVKNYVSRIYKKLGVTTRLELMNAALRSDPGPGET